VQGKPLRDAIMEVDENTLTWPEGLRMLLEILPTADEAAKLLAYDGDAECLDRPETMLRSIADVPRLQGRIKAMMFKAQLESEMDGVLIKQVLRRMMRTMPPPPNAHPHHTGPLRVSICILLSLSFVRVSL